MPAGRTEHRFLLVCLAAMVAIAGYLFVRSQQPPSPSGWEWETKPIDSQLSPPAEDDGEENVLIFVHVAGQVQSPGVYQLPKEARVVHAVEAAGGFTPDASVDAVNLAMGLVDGQRVYIPPLGTEEDSLATGIMNINQANFEELQSLPGIGPSLAREIMDYRARHGPFASVDELTGVSGIGEKTVASLREWVRVN